MGKLLGLKIDKGPDGLPVIHANVLNNLIEARASIGGKDLIGAQVNKLKADVVTHHKLIKLKTKSESDLI